MSKFGSWRWYVGHEEDDDEMCDAGTKRAAIAQGLREYPVGSSFYIVEARMLTSDEIAMSNGERETAPFAQTRKGQWIGGVLDA